MADPGTLLGRGIAFAPYVDASGALAWSDGPDNVRESIQIILMTEPGERLMRPEFGAGLRGFLFQPNNVATHKLMQQCVMTALARWEKRITVSSVLVYADPTDPAAAIVTVNYQLPVQETGDQVSVRIQLSA
jgi:phage baseplate assembly protein W